MGARGVWLAIGGMIGLACMDPTDGVRLHAVGRVQTTAGTAVAAATVSAYIAREGHCTRQEPPDGTGDTRSNGSYWVGIASPGETESTCVLVRVRAPLGSGLEDPVDTAVTLTFRYAAPLDSARVNAILPGP